jgi:hypothetical protein
MSDQMNPLGLDASAFVPQEATDAFARSEIVVSCVMSPGKGADRRCSLIVSTDPPSDIPHRNLGVIPHSAACTLAEIPQLVEGLLKEQESAFGEAWVNAWTEEQKLKAKTKGKGKPKTAAASPTNATVVKAALFKEGPDAPDPDNNEEDEVEGEEDVEEPETDASAQEEADAPEQEEDGESEEEQSEEEAPAAEAVPEPAQMSLLGGIEL